jgi:hypothetical protein
MCKKKNTTGWAYGNFRKIFLAVLLLIPVLCFAQDANVPPGQKVFVTNDKTTPVPVTITNLTGTSATIPYRKNLNTVPAAVFNDARANYYWCIEYIAGYFECAIPLDYVKIEIYKGNTIPVTLRMPVTVSSEGRNFTLSFLTKLRIAEGESLRIEPIRRQPTTAAIVRSDLQVSGYYEPIPR